MARMQGIKVKKMYIDPLKKGCAIIFITFRPHLVNWIEQSNKILFYDLSKENCA